MQDAPDRVLGYAVLHSQRSLLSNRSRWPGLICAAGVDHTVEFYPAHRGFVVADRDTYDEQAAERHWTALSDLCAAHL